MPPRVPHRRVAPLGAALVALVALAALAAAALAAPDPRGTWQGEFQQALRIVVHVRGAEGGALAASLDSPDQGAMGLPIERVTFAGDTLRLELTHPVASYVGRLSDAGDRIVGTWRQGGRSLPLELARADSLPALRRPQEPAPPYPYIEEQVRFDGEEPGISLAGTLTHPRGAGPFPAAVLITGSGPQDRDETVVGHRPFLVIADRLTRAGIAVLRMDDRGVGASSGPSEGSTTAQLAGDVRAAVRFLRTRAVVDPRRIGLIGHSEGGLIAPIVASGPVSVAFVVLLAGPGVPGEQVLLAQGEAIVRANGGGEGGAALERRVQQQLFALARQDLDSASVVEGVRRIFRAEGLDSALAGEGIASSVAAVRSPWMRFFLDYDPAPALSRVRCPVLALNGGRDVQVLPGQNLPAIERALRSGGNRDVTIRELPGLNHLFQHCTSGSPAEYARIEETFAPEALDTLTAWLASRAGR